MVYKNCVQDFIDDGTTIMLWCYNAACEHHGEMDLERLKAKTGPNQGMLFDEIKRHFYCSKCHGKNFGMTRMPKTVKNPYASAKGR
ncbi:hypothetical protein [Mesorhizobium sp. DCY119]|uniref:hypothetical protein n=1 Tax=Mesorhizobium sp. DCY119 TaxID=2108445 RepID=UPI000E6C657B|nr:hypothetical protein [Mesorhizobium sp. DCY119]RJG46476.1 hypothetical protein D3Y55_21005 [Mesorhizobium sp. DCY119]